MKILYATSEAVPFCKTGGLADVAGSLPAALAAEAAIVFQVFSIFRTVFLFLFQCRRLFL